MTGAVGTNYSAALRNGRERSYRVIPSRWALRVGASCSPRDLVSAFKGIPAPTGIQRRELLVRIAQSFSLHRPSENHLHFGYIGAWDVYTLQPFKYNSTKTPSCDLAYILIICSFHVFTFNTVMGLRCRLIQFYSLKFGVSWRRFCKL